MRFKYKKIIISASFSVMLLGMVVFTTKKSVATGTESAHTVVKDTTSVVDNESSHTTASGSSSGSALGVDSSVSTSSAANDKTNDAASSNNAAGISILMKNAYPEVNKLVEEYLEARLKVDKAEISKLVDNVNYAGIEELPKIMKNFESIKLDDCYTIDGPEENAKMVYAKTEIKIKGIDTTASSIDGFYVRADEGGDYKIILSPLPDEVQKIIADIKRDDVSALLSDVNTQFAREIKSDKKLADFFSKLQNREAGSNEEIKVSDGKDDAKSAKQKKEKSDKKSKSSKKNTKSKKSKKK